MLSKEKQCYKAKKPKKNRLSRANYKKYAVWLSIEHPMCQDPSCKNQADDHHHCKFGIYKDDTTLVNLCREHHIWAHANKKESQKRYMGVAQQNWSEYNGDY